MAENAVIGKVVLDFDFENEAGYNNFCDKLQEEFQEEFLNIFNEVLNKFPINRTIRLDKLSIDVGQIYSNDFNNFFTILKEELEKQLNLKYEVDSKSSSRSFSEMLLFYVENGFLPWWASSVQSVRSQQGMTSADLEFLHRNASKLLQNKSKFSRFYSAITEPEWDAFMQYYTESSYTIYRSVINILGKVIEVHDTYFTDSKVDLIKDLTYEFLILRSDTSQTNTQVFEALIKKLSDKTNLAQQDLMVLASTQISPEDSLEETLMTEIGRIAKHRSPGGVNQSVFDTVMSYLDPASSQSIGLLDLDNVLIEEFQKFILKNPEKTVKSFKESQFLRSEGNIEKLLFLMGSSVWALYKSSIEPKSLKNYEDVMTLLSKSDFSIFFGQTGGIKNIRKEIQKYIFKTIIEENKLPFKDGFKGILQMVSKLSSISLNELLLVFDTKEIIQESSAEVREALTALKKEDQSTNASMRLQLGDDLIALLKSNLYALFNRNDLMVDVIERSIQKAKAQFPIDSPEQLKNYDLFLESNFELLGQHLAMSIQDLKELFQIQLNQRKSYVPETFSHRYLTTKTLTGAADVMSRKYDLTEALLYFDQIDRQIDALYKSLAATKKYQEQFQRQWLSELDAIMLSVRYLEQQAVHILGGESLRTTPKSSNSETSFVADLGWLYNEVRLKSMGILNKLEKLKSFKQALVFDTLSTAAINDRAKEDAVAIADRGGNDINIANITFKQIKLSVVEVSQALGQLTLETDRIEKMLQKDRAPNLEIEQELFEQVQNLIGQSLSLNESLEEDILINVKRQSSKKQKANTAAPAKEFKALVANLKMQSEGLVTRLESLEFYANRSSDKELNRQDKATNRRVDNLKSALKYNKSVSEAELVPALKNVVSKIASSESLLKIQSELDQGIIHKPKSEHAFDQLDYLLNLNTNIAYDWVNTFEDLIADPNLMLQFLFDNKGDKEALLLFVDISLDELHSIGAKDLLNRIDARLMLIEDFFIAIQNKYIIATLNSANFRRIIRLLLIEFLSENPVSRNIDVEAFGFKVMTYFASNKRLDYKQVQLFSNLNTSATNPIENSVLEGINIFLERFLFQSVNVSVQNEIHFKDIVFYYLLNNKLPSWANIYGLTLPDTLQYLELRITKKDADFVKLVFNNKTILPKITDHVSALSEDLQNQILALLQSKGNTFQLANFYNAFLEHFGAVNISNKAENSAYLFKFILENRLWQASLPLSYFQNNFFSSEEHLNSFLTHFKVKKWSIEDQFNVATKADQQLLLNLYVESFDLSSFNLLWKKHTVKGIRNYLTKHPEALKALILNLSDLSHVNVRLLDIAPSFKALFDQFSQLINHPKPLQSELHQLIFDIVSSYDLTTTAATDLSKLVYTELVNGGNEAKKYFVFLDKLAAINPQLYESIMAKIRDAQSNPKHSINALLTEEISDRISTLKPSRTLELAKKQDWENIQYFLTFESLNYQTEDVTMVSIADLLRRLLQQDSVRLRKLFYFAGKSSGKLQKIIGLLKTNQAQKLISLIHQQFYESIDEVNVMLHLTYKTSLKKVFGFKTKKEEIVFYFEFWSANGEVIVDMIQFSQTLLIKSFELMKQRSSDFIELIEQDKSQLTMNQKLILDAMKKSLMVKTSKAEQNRPKETTTSLEELGLLDEDSIYIRNAGLVIAWPYLNTLFDKCGYLDGNKFKDIESRDKAVILSQYLVVGSDEILEEDLSLNKILLGIPLVEFVDASVQLTDFEKSMTESLLQGIIANWSTLGNTSVQGLRDTFLNREGALVKKDMDYKLKVKVETFDVLIPTIPWNITMIQTSFMNLRLLVEWK